MPNERIQKIIARYTRHSRRDADRFIRDGQVTVNGKVAQLGDKADAMKDAIKVNGKLLQKTEADFVYLVFNKPRGVISMLAQDRSGRPTLTDYLGTFRQKVFPVGRLDFNGEGMLLLTNDGDWGARVSKYPKLERTYELKIKGHPKAEDLDKLKKGVRTERGLLRPTAVTSKGRLKSKSIIEIKFEGSGAIEVKQLFRAKGFLVERVVLTGIGPLKLGDLPSGKVRLLKKTQAYRLIESG